MQLVLLYDSWADFDVCISETVAFHYESKEKATADLDDKIEAINLIPIKDRYNKDLIFAGTTLNDSLTDRQNGESASSFEILTLEEWFTKVAVNKVK